MLQLLEAVVLFNKKEQLNWDNKRTASAEKRQEKIQGVQRGTAPFFCTKNPRGTGEILSGGILSAREYDQGKGGSNTGNLTEKLMEELNCETVFTLPVLGGISESVVVTWIIMAVLVILSIILTRNLRVENPGKVQLGLEAAISWAQDFFEGVIGKENRRYIPYLITVLLYLAVANTIALFGFKPPTKDLNVTAALAVMSMFLIEYSGIRKNGLKHWIRHFGQPVPVVAPIMVLEVVIRPLSLCMRLFGNMLAGFVVLELLKYFVPLIVPIPVSFYFEIFEGLLQAYVFVFLTALFMTEEME